MSDNPGAPEAIARGRTSPLHDPLLSLRGLDEHDGDVEGGVIGSGRRGRAVFWMAGAGIAVCLAVRVALAVAVAAS